MQLTDRVILTAPVFALRPTNPGTKKFVARWRRKSRSSKLLPTRRSRISRKVRKFRQPDSRSELSADASGFSPRRPRRITMGVVVPGSQACGERRLGYGPGSHDDAGFPQNNSGSALLAGGRSGVKLRTALKRIAEASAVAVKRTIPNAIQRVSAATRSREGRSSGCRLLFVERVRMPPTGEEAVHQLCTTSRARWSWMCR